MALCFSSILFKDVSIYLYWLFLSIHWSIYWLVYLVRLFVCHFEWILEVLVGFHVIEPFLGIMLDKVPRPTHLDVKLTFQSLYKQMMDPIEGIRFSSVNMHALPALIDGFSRLYKKSWIDSFLKHREQYDDNKVETVMQTIMKQLAATLSR